MSNLTRIKNNQITDSTILANTKIVPGSIVGSLFNANLTMTSDVTITGNLTVQGVSTYLTVASTNTYVNDPLIVMNNAFSGTNTYDIGLLFNRGNQINQAFIWDESEDEFKLIATTDTGTTYGNVSASSFANLHIGNLTVDYNLTLSTLTTSGDITANDGDFSGDLAVNGGDFTSNVTTFNLLDSGVTTLNVGGAATTLTIGGTSGTASLRNANIWLPNATTLDGAQATVGVFNLATTVDAFKAGTDVEIGAASGLLQLNNANVWVPNATTLDGAQTTISLFTQNATTVDAFKAATNIEFGATSGFVLINNPSIEGSQATQDLFTSSATTTLNLATKATTVAIGGTTGTASIRNANLYLPNATTIFGGQATVSAFSLATALTLSATTGNTAIRNNLDVGLTVTARDINATVIGNVIPASGKFTNVYDTNLTATRVTFAGAGSQLVDDADFTYNSAENQLTIKNITIDGTNNIISTTNTNANLVLSPNGSGAVDVDTSRIVNVTDPVELQDAVTLNYLNQQISSAVTNIQLDDTDITITDNGTNPGIITANVDATSVVTIDANTASLYSGLVTVDALNNNVAVDGTFFASNDITVANGGQVFIKDTTASAATNQGALQVVGGVGVGGNLNVGGLTNLTGKVELLSTTESTNATSGALVVDGGAGIGANLNVGGNLTVSKDVVVQGNLTVQGTSTTLNTSTLDVEDLNITVAKGAGSAAAANGAGLTVDGASATLLYADADDSWNVNKLFKGTAASFSSTLGVTGDTTLTGDLAVNGGDLTTSQTTFNLLNSTTTTLNVGGGATTLTLGATSGTASLRNANIWVPNATTIDGAQTTVSLLTQNATTIEAFTKATTANIGAGSGTLTINNPTVLGQQATQNLYNTVATTMNFAGAATTLTVGAASGTASLRNANIWLPNATTLDGAQTSVSLFTQNATTVDAFKSATDLEFGATSGTLTINNPTVVGTQTTQNVFNSAATTVNAFGAATTLIVGATSGVANIRNATTNIIGNATVGGTLDVTGAVTLTDDLAVNGGDLTTSQTTFNVFNTNATTVNAFGAATSVVAGATTGTFNVRNANLYLPNASTIYSGQSTLSIANENVTALSAGGAATTLTLGATSGTASIRNANLALPNATTIYMGQSNVFIANTAVTDVEMFGDATFIKVGNVGGVTGFRGQVYSHGVLTADSGTFSSNVSTGAIVVPNSGGVGISGNLHVGFQANINLLNVLDSTASTYVTDGALTVVGGVGISKNINVAQGAAFNLDQSTQAFRVYGKFANTLIYADSVKDTVVIGGSTPAGTAGTTLTVNGTGAMIIPIGSSSARPGASGNVDVDGMIRLNSTTNVFEYYIDGGWQTSQGSFTVISSDSFSGNGVANAFVLSSNSTTGATMVMINGVVQIPGTSYSISGNVLTFTESPETGDAIDVRSLTTTVTVAEVGFNFQNFKANIDYAYITTGAAAATERMLIDVYGKTTFTGDVEIYGNLNVLGNSDGQITIGDTAGDNVAFNADVNSSVTPNADDTYSLGSASKRWKNVFAGNIVHDQTAVNVTANATPYIIDAFAKTSYSTAKYIVQVKDDSSIESSEVLLVQDTANAFVTTYGVVASGSTMGTFSANIVGSDVRLYYTSTSLSNSNVKVQTTYIV